jgi:hypothetical protein
MPHLDELAAQAITARPCLIAEMQARSASRQPLYQLANVIGPVGNRSPVPNLTASLTLRNRNRNRRLVDIQPDERATLHVVSPPFSGESRLGFQLM